jgi:hypothetical protein
MNSWTVLILAQTHFVNIWEKIISFLAAENYCNERVVGECRAKEKCICQKFYFTLNDFIAK